MRRFERHRRMKQLISPWFLEHGSEDFLSSILLRRMHAAVAPNSKNRSVHYIIIATIQRE
jgi:hypothetical protein